MRMYTLIFWCMKKKSKYRIRMDELKRFKKKHKLTKKEKERVEMWVESGHSVYDTRWWDDVGRILRTFKIKKNVEVTDNGKIII